MKALAMLTARVTATEKQLVTQCHEGSPLTEWATRFTLPLQSEEIQPKDTHHLADFGGLLDSHCYHTETYCQWRVATKNGVWGV